MPALKYSRTFFFAALIFLLSACETSSAEKQVIGWVENVVIFPGNLKIKAKLDTGARHSSLNATLIEAFGRDGVKWIRFNVTNWKGRTEQIETEVVRMATIKQHGTESATRPVIRLGICRNFENKPFAMPF